MTLRAPSPESLAAESLRVSQRPVEDLALNFEDGLFYCSESTSKITLVYVFTHFLISLIFLALFKRSFS